MLYKKGMKTLKELYATPEAEIIRFMAEDIITTSASNTGNDNGGYNGENDDPGKDYDGDPVDLPYKPL